MSLKIEAGKFYRMRGVPNKARLYATDGCGYSPIHGAITGPAGWEPMQWLREGRNQLSPVYDLISEWIDLPEVDWDAMPNWANWVAMDADRQWFWYQSEPTIALTEINWRANEDCVGNTIPAQFAPSFSGDWKQSLVQRPESK